MAVHSMAQIRSAGEKHAALMYYIIYYLKSAVLNTYTQVHTQRDRETVTETELKETDF